MLRSLEVHHKGQSANYHHNARDYCHHRGKYTSEIRDDLLYYHQYKNMNIQLH